MQSGLWIVVCVAVFGATTGFYYYFKIIKAMYWGGGASAAEVGELKVGRLAKVSILILLIAVFFLGVFPGVLLDLSQ